jgi:hypothetical protein
MGYTSVYLQIWNLFTLGILKTVFFVCDERIFFVTGYGQIMFVNESRIRMSILEVQLL